MTPEESKVRFREKLEREAEELDRLWANPSRDLHEHAMREAEREMTPRRQTRANVGYSYAKRGH